MLMLCFILVFFTLLLHKSRYDNNMSCGQVATAMTDECVFYKKQESTVS